MSEPRIQKPLGEPPPNACLCPDDGERKRRVAENLARQYDVAVRLVNESAGVFCITPEILKNLQRIAIENIYVCAGEYRTWPISISGTSHAPPNWRDIPSLIAQMCDYANSTPGSTPIHTAAYRMWRLNWIHPFGGGNGRTSRAVSHFALCVRLGFVIQGWPTIPEQIMSDREPYYAALDDADAAWTSGKVDVGSLESLLSEMLKKQLMSIYHAAGGT